MDYIGETEKLLNDLIGVDCASIVMKLTFARCSICKAFEYEVFCLESYDNTYVCGGCYIEDDFYDCRHCGKIYPVKLFNFCSRCLGNCFMYCPIHLKSRYKITNVGDIEVIMDIVDDIINVIDIDTVFNNRYY